MMFFWEMISRNMGMKTNLIHFCKICFRKLEPFLDEFGFKVSKKVLIWLYNFFFTKFYFRYQKGPEFYSAFITVEKNQSKLLTKKLLTFEVSKSGTFKKALEKNFWIISMNLKSIKNFAFFIPMYKKNQIKVLGPFSTHSTVIFEILEGKLAYTWKLKISKKFIYNCKVHSSKLLTMYEKSILQNFYLLSPVSLTPLTNKHSRISPRTFEKNRNSPFGVLRGLGGLEADKYRVGLPLNSRISLVYKRENIFVRVSMRYRAPWQRFACNAIHVLQHRRKIIK